MSANPIKFPVLNKPELERTAFDDLPEAERRIAKALTAKMASLQFPAIFTRYESGPIITSYYFKPLPTAPLSRIMSKTEDLALAVGTESILIQRILDEISVQVPNKEPTLIKFENCLYNLFRDNKEYVLPLLLGQDSVGNQINIDLIEQPHLLIAGQTGSGKSVFLHELICSLSIAKTPDELKFILVDTKQLELTLYNHLDHTDLVIDKITKLHPVLHDLLSEVRKRTEMMKGAVRNLQEWNREYPKLKKPFIILIIDELADVLAQDKALAKEEDKDNKRTRINELLGSLAQISRAAGIHIIAATQRPSVDIIKGSIKTNLTGRVCFKLPQSIDSRVVLDENGAESLLGKGDFLYKTGTDSTIRRGHSAFVSLTMIETILTQHEMIRSSLKG